MLIAWAPMLLLLRRSWEKLQDAIQQIFNENAGELSFEELYRTGYNMVLHKHGDMLYQNVETVLKERSGALCEKVAQNTDKTLVPPPRSPRLAAFQHHVLAQAAPRTRARACE